MLVTPVTPWLRQIRLRHIITPHVVTPVTPNSVTPHGYATYGTPSLLASLHRATSRVTPCVTPASLPRRVYEFSDTGKLSRC